MSRRPRELQLAAVYARKSKAQKGVADSAKSVTLQVETGKAEATRRGYRVPDANVFVDDGLSGADFDRPGLNRMLEAAERHASTVLIVSEQKSIGREMSETAFIIKRLARAGVEVFEYMHGRCLTPKTAVDKVLGSVQGFADEAHREATRERMHRATRSSPQTGGCAEAGCSGIETSTYSPARTGTATR